ncbi:IclR family transcriptional regulator [Paraburkholderia sp. SIMBA_049]
MSTVIERSFRILEELSFHPGGRTLSELSAAANAPLSATHRLLADLVEEGYVRKDERHDEFVLTMRVVSLGLRFLSAGGITDVAQPTLERLAAVSGELVRLALVDEDQLIYVAKAQGAMLGLRYDPEMGAPVRLWCSAAGYTWLATKSEDEAIRLLGKQEFPNPANFGPAAPTTIKAVLNHIQAAKKQGFATTTNIFLPAMSSMATCVRDPQGETLGTLIIAGPMTRLTEARMQELGPALQLAADELGRNSSVSPVFKRQSNRLAPESCL